MEPLIHPKAYLAYRRNVKTGLASRSRIIKALEKKELKTLREISEATGLSYSTVTHHVRLLREEGVLKLERIDNVKRWSLTGYGQQSLL
ncbi:MAG: winged helix-turn-helix domain-containing protein [Candidatus Bathyarchaeia archaeon]